MIFHFVILFIGCSYLYYCYTSVSDKRRFFRSPLFVGTSGSLLILLAVILFVNIIRPEAPASQDVKEEANVLSVEEADTTSQNLLKQDPRFHYELILKIANDDNQYMHLHALEGKYRDFAASADVHVSSLGNFCLGVIRLGNGNDQEAIDFMDKVLEDEMPYVHFCKGMLLEKQHKSNEASVEFTKELENESGNKTPALLYLLKIYSRAHNFQKLHELLQYPEADEVFPEDLARTTSLRAFDFKGYYGWLWKKLVRKSNVLGFSAAFLIAAMWLFYLFKLDIFKPEKFVWLLALFAGGMISVPIVFLIGDIAEMFTSWSLNDRFFNDLFYAIFMIGVPEEFAKAFPLFLLIIFRKSLNEPIDYVIYGCASALGFAFIENLLYFETIEGGIIHGRAYLSVIGHMADTSFVAYGFVVARFKLKNNTRLWYLLPVWFMLAAIVHGIYDLLLFQEMLLVFFIYFILIVQIWLIMVNNCMNNSSHFTYKLAPEAERSRVLITLALTAIFAFEYLAVSFMSGAKNGNEQLLGNSVFAGFFIIFFSSNLGSFDLIRGYWRDVRFRSKEKRGYGSRQKLHPLISWYFVNASRAHNYVGINVYVTNERHNTRLSDVLDRPYRGEIINRIILYDEGIADPDWFLIKMAEHLIAFGDERPDYILVKLRYNEDSLLYEDEVEVYFRAITDARELRERRPDKKYFPFYGWANISMQKQPAVSQALIG